MKAKFRSYRCSAMSADIVRLSTAFMRNVTAAAVDVNVQKCKPGVVLPVWLPQADELTPGDVVGRALVYAFSLAYLFLGVSIIADRFMAAIEVITSQERELHVTDQNGNEQIVMVRYWNETVSNLTVPIQVFGSITKLSPPPSLSLSQMYFIANYMHEKSIYYPHMNFNFYHVVNRKNALNYYQAD